MSFASELRTLADPALYPPLGKPDARWGQTLRENPALRRFMLEAREKKSLVPLRSLARVTSGVVPRANAYFLVRELPLEEVPERFRVTERDYRRIAIVEDGMKARHKVERLCLRPTLKGPEALIGPAKTAKTDERLFDCLSRSKEDLRKLRANGALTYLKRGETVDYRVSSDSLKGGIPARRAQVKNRRPYWYSLHSPAANSARLAIPEHFDRRFVSSLIPADFDAVVIDTLYSVEPHAGVDPSFLLASLNTLLTWYQLETRGRTQHGEGVLKVKIADWDSVLILDPREIVEEEKTSLLSSFNPLRERRTWAVDREVVDSDRLRFDERYLSLCGAEDPASLRTDVERQLRAAMSERHERARSMDQAKAAKSAPKKATASVDAFASRIAARLEPYPDPRQFAPKTLDDGQSNTILVSTPWEGTLSVGEDLLSQGDVLAGEQIIAHAGDLLAAQYVRGVLLHDPDSAAVAVPLGEERVETMKQWESECKSWLRRFEEESEKTLVSVADARTKAQVRERALLFLHAR